MSIPHTHHMPTTILKSSVPLYGIDVSKNQFHNGIDFSQGIDSVESMPGGFYMRALTGATGTFSKKIHETY
jgi:hypothetical protein